MVLTLNNAINMARKIIANPSKLYFYNDPMEILGAIQTNLQMPSNTARGNTLQYYEGLLNVYNQSRGLGNRVQIPENTPQTQIGVEAPQNTSITPTSSTGIQGGAISGGMILLLAVGAYFLLKKGSSWKSTI